MENDGKLNQPGKFSFRGEKSKLPHLKLGFRLIVNSKKLKVISGSETETARFLGMRTSTVIAIAGVFHTVCNSLEFWLAGLMLLKFSAILRSLKMNW